MPRAHRRSASAAAAPANPAFEQGSPIELWDDAEKSYVTGFVQEVRNNQWQDEWTTAAGWQVRAPRARRRPACARAPPPQEPHQPTGRRVVRAPHQLARPPARPPARPAQVGDGETRGLARPQVALYVTRYDDGTLETLRWHKDHDDLDLPQELWARYTRRPRLQGAAAAAAGGVVSSAAGVDASATRGINPGTAQKGDRSGLRGGFRSEFSISGQYRWGAMRAADVTRVTFVCETDAAGLPSVKVAAFAKRSAAQAGPPVKRYCAGGGEVPADLDCEEVVFGLGAGVTAKHFAALPMERQDVAYSLLCQRGYCWIHLFCLWRANKLPLAWASWDSQRLAACAAGAEGVNANAALEADGLQLWAALRCLSPQEAATAPRAPSEHIWNAVRRRCSPGRHKRHYHFAFRDEGWLRLRTVSCSRKVPPLDAALGDDLAAFSASVSAATELQREEISALEFTRNERVARDEHGKPAPTAIDDSLWGECFLNAGSGNMCKWSDLLKQVGTKHAFQVCHGPAPLSTRPPSARARPPGLRTSLPLASHASPGLRRKTSRRAPTRGSSWGAPSHPMASRTLPRRCSRQGR